MAPVLVLPEELDEELLELLLLDELLLDEELGRPEDELLLEDAAPEELLELDELLLEDDTPPPAVLTTIPDTVAKLADAVNLMVKEPSVTVTFL